MMTDEQIEEIRDWAIEDRWMGIYSTDVDRAIRAAYDRACEDCANLVHDASYLDGVFGEDLANDFRELKHGTA
jgi:hypothetical protein